jgi:uncharacterized protein YhaN
MDILCWQNAEGQITNYRWKTDHLKPPSKKNATVEETIRQLRQREQGQKRANSKATYHTKIKEKQKEHDNFVRCNSDKRNDTNIST